MSDSVLPHIRQPTRLLHPWDSPGKNIAVGCHFLLQCMKVKSESEVAQSCSTLCNPMDCRPPGSSVHGIFQARVLEWVAIAFSIRNGYTDINKGTLHSPRKECLEKTGNSLDTYVILHSEIHRMSLNSKSWADGKESLPDC